MTQVRTARSKKRPPLAPHALQVLRRLTIWRSEAHVWPTPHEFVDHGTRDWMSLQGLLGRGYVNLNDRGQVRLTAHGWRYLRANGSA